MNGVECVKKIQPEIDNVYKWCSANRLRLNVDKSKILVIGSQSKLLKIDYNHSISLNHNPLRFATKYKYLGVTLDNEMNLTSFLSDVKKSVLQKLYNLCKLRYYVSEKGALAIYKQTILPLFEFSGFMLIACTKSDGHDLQVIQNDALHTCFNVKRRDKVSILKMHIKANLLRLEQRCTMQLLRLMYVHKSNPVNLIHLVRNTRAADLDQFYVERYSNCKYKNSPFYKGVEIWKMLPNDLVTTDTQMQFRLALKARYKNYDPTLF